MELGKRIAEIRKDNALTQEGLAEICNVTRQTISNWENGKSYPDLETLVLISDKFNVSLDTMLKGDRKMVSEISREQKHGKRFILRSAIAIFVAAIVIFAGVCYADIHESFISYEDSGISVSDSGDMFTGRNYRRLVSFRFTEESDNGEHHQTVFIFLTSNIFTRLFNKGHNDKTPFVGYGKVDGRTLGDDGKLHDSIVTEVYYLPEEYAVDNSLLNSKRSQLVPISASEQEAKAAIEQMKADSVLLWVRK